MENKLDSRDVFLTGKIILLSVLNEGDALSSNWYGWFNDETINQNTQHHKFPNSREQQVTYWKSDVKDNKTKLQLGIRTIENPDKLIGVVSLSEIDLINQKASISLMLGEPEGRNIKIFIEAFQMMIQHAFNSLNLRRIYGGALNKEIADIMCRVLKFKIEGILVEDVYKDGAFKDVYRLGMLKGE